MVLARPDERETSPYHFSLRLFTMVMRSSLWPDCPLDLCTNFIFVMWSLYEMGSALLLIFIDSIVLCSSAVGSTIHKHTGRWMWQESASVASWNWEKYCQCKLFSTLSMLLLSVLSWGVSQAWNPRQMQLSLGTCDCLKLLSVYFDLLLNAAGVVCR